MAHLVLIILMFVLAAVIFAVVLSRQKGSPQAAAHSGVQGRPELLLTDEHSGSQISARRADAEEAGLVSVESCHLLAATNCVPTEWGEGLFHSPPLAARQIDSSETQQLRSPPSSELSEQSNHRTVRLLKKESEHFDAGRDTSESDRPVLTSKSPKASATSRLELPAEAKGPVIEGEPEGSHEGEWYSTMRITKRPSGGRGEYEISESLGAITPRDLLDRMIVVDLGSGIEISTGVRLLLRHGKLRLRIDSHMDGKIHLHRQLAAALLLPHPAREESAWTTDPPVMQSGLYGITNISLSAVALAADDIAKVSIRSITVANRNGQESVSPAQRVSDLVSLWGKQAELPPRLGSLISEHRRLVETGGPLGRRSEEVVSALQRATADDFRERRLEDYSPAEDVLPVLIRLLQPAPALAGSAITAAATLDTNTDASSIAEPDETVGATAQTDRSVSVSDCGPSLSDAGLFQEISITQGPSEFGLSETDVQAGVATEYEELTPESELAQSSEEIPSSDRGPLFPRRYRPQRRGRLVTPTDRRSGSNPAPSPRGLTLPVDLRLRRRLGGTLLLSLLPRRRAGMPPELEVISGDQLVQLSATHEDWYEDVGIQELGIDLSVGIAWFACEPNGQFRWNLSGREVFVLGTRDALSGFVSIPRLVVGAQHFVLCSQGMLRNVLEVLNECCATVLPILGEGGGLPPGWVAVGPLVPTVPLPQIEAGDILDALRPDPTLVITLEGGIRVQANQFLEGYPPRVRIYGNVPPHLRVAIDGDPAQVVNGTFKAADYDAPGEHVVTCGPMTRTYSIVVPEDRWDNWPAYCVSLNAQGGPISICGGLVMQGHVAALLVPVSAPVLLGSKPGEVYEALVRKDMRMPVCAAFPTFRPVWAVPRDPLHADKGAARVLLLQERPVAARRGRADRNPRPHARNVLQWCRAILDCGLKRLGLEPAGGETKKLWTSYRDLARSIWRASK